MVVSSNSFKLGHSQRTIYVRRRLPSRLPNACASSTKAWSCWHMSEVPVLLLGRIGISGSEGATRLAPGWTTRFYLKRPIVVLRPQRRGEVEALSAALSGPCSGRRSRNIVCGLSASMGGPEASETSSCSRTTMYVSIRWTITL